MIPPRRAGRRLPLLRDYAAFRSDPLNFWLDVGRQGPLVEVELGPSLRYWVVTDFDLFQQIFQTRSKNYPRSGDLRNGASRLDPARTVFNVETYEEWRWRRRLLQPGFHRDALTGYADSILGEGVRTLSRLEDKSIIELEPFLKQLTMRIIGRTLFSANLDETHRLQETIEQMTMFSFSRLSAMFNLPVWIPTPAVVRTKRAIDVRKRILAKIVEERLASGENRGDMLDMLIAAQLDDDEIMPGRRFDGNELVAEMGSLVFAGHETTAMTLVWLIYRVATTPAVQLRLLDEIDEVLGVRPPNLEDLERMPFTHQLILETLRFYPSVYLTLRQAESRDRLVDAGGEAYDVPAGTRFLMNVRGLHRMADHWHHPDRFRPERFEQSGNEDRHKFAFQPFISGPRKCIGDQFAMMEMRLLVPLLFQRLRFEDASDGSARSVAGFVMGTDRPIRMRVMAEG